MEAAEILRRLWRIFMSNDSDINLVMQKSEGRRKQTLYAFRIITIAIPKVVKHSQELV